MKACEVVELAREWVEGHGSKTPGFRGAHLMGALNYFPRDAPFPSYKDVDLNVVLEGEEQSDVHDIPYKGLMLEYCTLGMEPYRFPEVVLASPNLAPNLAVDSILADPMGILAALHQAVAKEYRHRKWVLARCDASKNAARESLAQLGRAGSPAEALDHLGWLSLHLAALVAMAGLRPPTYRRCLVLTKQVLEAWGWAGLQEEMLDLLGCAHLSRSQVEAYLQDCAAAFDKATEVTRTPMPFAFKLRPHLKPYLVEGSKEMIEEGNHREAMLWIAVFALISVSAIAGDAPEDVEPAFLAMAGRLVHDAGIVTPEDMESRRQRAQELANRIFAAADDIVSRNTEIVE